MNLRKIKLEGKLLGVNIIIPILIIFGTISMLLKRDIKSLDNEALSILELFIPIASSWITIFKLREVFEVCGNELIFSIEKNRKNLGLYKVIRGVLYYALILYIAIFILSNKVESINFISVYLELLMCGLFLSSISFLTVVIFKNSLLSISLIVIYVFSMLFIGQAYFKEINIFIFSESINSMNVVLNNSIKIIIYSIVILFISQYKVNTLEEFNYE